MTRPLAHPPHVNLSLGNPGELIASIPHILGFHPVDSLIAIGLHSGPGTSVGLTLRVDLPPPTGHDQTADSLLLPFLDSPPAAAISITVCELGPDPLDDLPHRALLHVVEDRFADAGIPFVHHLWTPSTRRGARWRCYEELGCTGVLPNPDVTQLGMAVTEAGMITFGSREEVGRSLHPDDPSVLSRRAGLLARASAAAEPTRGWPDRLDELLRTVRTAVELATQDEVSLTDEDVVALVDALSDEHIRDYCLGYVETDEVLAAERLWAALVRGTPAPECATPAGLLAFSAYARGDGVYAGIALEFGEAADPGNELVRILRGSLNVGLPPKAVRRAAVQAGRRARTALRELLEDLS